MSDSAIMQQLPSQLNLLQAAGHLDAISNPRDYTVELPRLRELRRTGFTQLVHARRLKVIDKDLSHHAHSYGDRRIVCLEISGMIDARGRPRLLRAKREKERWRHLTEIGEVIGGHDWWGQRHIG